MVMSICLISASERRLGNLIEHDGLHSDFSGCMVKGMLLVMRSPISDALGTGEVIVCLMTVEFNPALPCEQDDRIHIFFEAERGFLIIDIITLNMLV